MQIPDFKDQQLWVTALTHRSALNEHASQATESNERLEYLGDAVLELVSTEFLYRQLPDASEGKLTAIRSSLVKTTTLSSVAKQLGVGEKLFLSRGEEANGGRVNEAILADTMEAIIGAMYLDQGLDKAREFITEAILSQYDQIMENKSYIDAKTAFQEEVQALGYETPVYRVEKEDTSDKKRRYLVSAWVGQEMIACAYGHNKQVAEQEAAHLALGRLVDDAYMSTFSPADPMSDAKKAAVPVGEAKTPEDMAKDVI